MTERTAFPVQMTVMAFRTSSSPTVHGEGHHRLVRILLTRRLRTPVRTHPAFAATGRGRRAPRVADGSRERKSRLQRMRDLVSLGDGPTGRTGSTDGQSTDRRGIPGSRENQIRSLASSDLGGENDSDNDASK
jgi:hypothetical protein